MGRHQHTMNLTHCSDCWEPYYDGLAIVAACDITLDGGLACCNKSVCAGGCRCKCVGCDIGLVIRGSIGGAWVTIICPRCGAWNSYWRTWNRCRAGREVSFVGEIFIETRLVAARWFVLVVLLSDGFMKIRKQNKKWRMRHARKLRFLRIMRRLPMELQMRICARVLAGDRSEFVGTRELEAELVRW